MTTPSRPDAPAGSPPATRRGSTRRIRLSIPFWGEAYFYKMIHLTLPALMAPGNLPALAQAFDVELALVTESRFFEALGASRAFPSLQRLADVRLVPLDDLLTGIHGDYGPVLTFALIRGYEDLGERMLDYYLMFLNADFILADGSYRTIVRLIEEGHQIIHCPSFRAVREDVTPVLEERVSLRDGVLAVPPREMVALALRHKHISVKARIVNQQLCHQRLMDQFYWYVDDCTLIGYQCPIALVALRPERVVTRPTLMFDYGFIPEICPTAPKHYISDSDDFFMLEPQERSSGQDLVRLGWPSPGEIGYYLTAYSTKEQRECGRQMHVFHSAELPADMSAVVSRSKAYMVDLLGRVGPPHPHDRHPLFHDWWHGVLGRIEGGRARYAEQQRRAARPAEKPAAPPLAEAATVAGAGDGDGIAPSREATPAPVPAAPDASGRSAPGGPVRVAYHWLFGHPGRRLKTSHPLWLGTHSLSQAFADEVSSGSRVLWVSADTTKLRYLAEQADAWLSTADLGSDVPDTVLFGDEPFDGCLFDLSLAEYARFRPMYERLRPHVRNGGHVYLSVTRTQDGALPLKDSDLAESALPDTDVSEAVFSGSRVHHVVRALYEESLRPRFASGILRRALHVGTLTLLAPVSWVTNRRYRQGTAPPHAPDWLNMFARFTIVRRDDPSPGHRHRELAETGRPRGQSSPKTV